LTSADNGQGPAKGSCPSSSKAPRFPAIEQPAPIRRQGGAPGGPGRDDTIYGLNAAVYTTDVDHARQVASRIRSGTIGQNGFKTDFSIAFGGFKQSGLGREGGVEGLLSFTETKTVVLDGKPSGYQDWERPADGPDISMLRSVRSTD
jgi:Aldehyde dehydrogenase family